jgi:hypothetical protein
MRPKKLTYSPADADADGYVDGGSGASLTLLASSAGDGLAHQLNFTSSANISDHTFTVVGTDENGMAQTEVVTGPNNTTVESASYFLTVTSITPNATLGSDEVDIGWVDEFVTPTKRMNYHASEASLRFVVAGTINFDVEQTFDDMRKADQGETFEWSTSTDTDLDGATASQISVLDKPVTGIRIKANSYSSGASIDMYVVQARS